jgi:fructose-1,6-bisphosphatase I
MQAGSDRGGSQWSEEATVRTASEIANGELGGVLAAWAGGDTGRRGVAATLNDLAGAAVAIGRQLAAAPLVGGFGESVGTNASGDTKKVLDDIANQLVADALDDELVAAFASEESESVAVRNPSAPLVVAVDPLDGSANLPINGPIGMVFSVRPATGGDPAGALYRPGAEQLAAGFVFFGPATMMALTVGEGTDLYALGPDGATFVRTAASVQIPPRTAIYSVNASNARHWYPEFRSFITDLQAGAEGSLGEDFNMRWYGALVMEALRMLLQGGIYLYPADRRPRFRSGLLRLVYEAHPVAMLIEQAGGVATDGKVRILDKAAGDVHERTPLIFGSADRVEEALARIDVLHRANRAPLFGDRGLLRG